MDSPSSFSHQQRWVIISLIFGACLPLVDVTILGIAIPDLAQSFNVTIARLQWVSVLYTVTATMTVTTCAWATRQIGAKRLWFTGLCLFTVSSLFAAISPNVEILLFSRALQGVGAGIIMAGMQTVLVLAVGKPMLKTAMATMAVPTVLAPIAGPVLAGYLLHIGDWRWIFYINVPIGMIAIALARIKLPDDDSRSPIRFDLRGFMMLAPALLLLIFSLSSLSDLNKPSGHFGLIIGACVFLGVLLLWIFSKHSHQRGEQALVRLSPFQVKSFRASMCLLFFSSAGFYAGLFALPILFITELGHSEWLASFWIGIQGVGALIARPYLKSLCDRIGVGYTGLTGVLLSALGTFPLLMPGVHSHYVLVALCMLARGAGMGLLTLLGMSHAFHDLTPQQTPDASVLSRIFTLLGASVGPAAIVFLFSLHWELTSLEWVISGLGSMALVCIWPSLHFIFSLKLR